MDKFFLMSSFRRPFGNGSTEARFLEECDLARVVDVVLNDPMEHGVVGYARTRCGITLAADDVVKAFGWERIERLDELTVRRCEGGLRLRPRCVARRESRGPVTLLRQSWWATE